MGNGIREELFNGPKIAQQNKRRKGESKTIFIV
jgi:hypothetical protein